MSFGKQLSLLGLQLPSRLPTLWVKRLVLYASDRDNKIIRDIPLQPGMNIVWSTSQSPSSGSLGGHNAGKTSFCRLLRYCLGENSYGTDKNQKQIASLFPDGMVGAEIEANGNTWAVARSFKSDGKKMAIPDGALEELLGCVNPEPFQNFVNYIEQVCLSRFSVSTFAKHGQPIRWGHVLSWLTRDQEARFTEFHQFRSPRSNSHAPIFPKSKEDAHTLLRSALHLLNSDSEMDQEKIQEINKKLRSVRREQAKRQQESGYWDQELTRRLREKLDIPADEMISWDSADLFDHSIRQRYKERIAELDCTTASHQKEISRIQNDINENNRRVGGIDLELGKVKSILEARRRFFREMEGVSNKSANDPEEEWRAVDCTPVGIKIIECPLAREKWAQEKRRQDNKSIVDLKEYGNRRWEDHQTKGGADDLSDLERQAADLELQKQEIEQRLRDLPIQRKQEEDRLRQVEKRAQSLTDLATEAEYWRNRRQLRNTESRQREETKKTLEKEKTSIGAHIYLMEENHRDRIRLFSSLFNAIVQEVLAADVRGRIQLDGETALFSLSGNQSTLGEATTSLSIALGDISSLLFALWQDTPLPGFLIHDSPRDADMAEGLYHNFLLFINWLQEGFCSDKIIPYQYIITTTTPPPLQLQSDSWVKLHLNSDDPEGTLFK
ncbi:MAG: hypothetical protein HQL74_07825 [Magnetococcales bacterium]|nr:hypothetical protein [Magnetococcales bacterium]